MSLCLSTMFNNFYNFYNFSKVINSNHFNNKEKDQLRQVQSILAKDLKKYYCDKKSILTLVAEQSSVSISRLAHAQGCGFEFKCFPLMFPILKFLSQPVWWHLVKRVKAQVLTIWVYLLTNVINLAMQNDSKFLHIAGLLHQYYNLIGYFKNLCIILGVIMFFQTSW